MTWLRAAFRWSWVVTVPAAVGFLTWLIGFVDLYRDFQLRYDISPHAFTWRVQGASYADQLARRLGASLRPIENPDLPIVNLFVGGDELATLDSELPHSGFEYVRGQLLDATGFLDVKVRYRGDFFYHWAFEKKSLRVKTKKTQRYAGLRTFNLVVPKFVAQVTDQLGYALAGHLGLMAPRAEFVWVYLNGRCRGLHLLVEQIEESTLRDRDRMPGDIYAGELVAKDAWVGIDSAVFDHPGLWEKVAVNNHFPAQARAPLERLCELLAAAPSEAQHAELAQLLDLEKFARMSALEVLIGYFHTGETHNWRLYWDPWRTRFEPIVWDPCAYGGFEQFAPFGAVPTSLDPNVSRLHNVLLGNAEFLRARQQALVGFFTSGRVEAYRADLRRAVAVARFCIDHDPLMLPADPGLVGRAVDGLLPHAESLLAGARAAFAEPSAEVRWARLPDGVRVTVADRVPVTAVELRLRQPAAAGVGARLRIARTGEQLERKLPSSQSLGGRRLRFEAALNAQLEPFFRVERAVFKVLSHRVAATSFDFVVDGLPPDAEVLGVDVVRQGGAGCAPAVRAPVAALPAPHHDLLYGTALDEPAPPQRWSGEVALEGLTVVAGELWLEAGTTVRLGPDASLIVRGRCTVDGAADAPVRFVRSEPGAPWGTFALVGRGASGSALRHAQFDGGSGLKDPAGMFEYSAMVSVHDVADAAFTDCSFERGSVVDDMVHVVYGDVTFERCRFVECPADALDVDIAAARLRACTFERAGNDGLDLMTARADVADCRFEQCGDKGISVGEGSRLLALSCQFDGCAIGVQVKDGSRAAIGHGSFAGCGQALDAYLKNWRYARGGSLDAWSCAFSRSARPPAADPASRIGIGRAAGTDPAATAPRVVVADGAEPPPLPWLAELRGDAEARWAAAARRGAPWSTARPVPC